MPEPGAICLLVRAVPHWPQKRKPAGFTAPQTRHLFSADLAWIPIAEPQWLQKRAWSGFAVPQTEQETDMMIGPPLPKE